MKTGKQKAVVVTTEHKGVFFGYVEERTEKTITLSKARMVVYWSSETRGLLGTATKGPQKGSRVSPPVERIELQNITAVIDATDEAAKAWEAEPWS